METFKFMYLLPKDQYEAMSSSIHIDQVNAASGQDVKIVQTKEAPPRRPRKSTTPRKLVAKKKKKPLKKKAAQPKETVVKTGSVSRLESVAPNAVLADSGPAVIAPKSVPPPVPPLESVKTAPATTAAAPLFPLVTSKSLFPVKNKLTKRISVLPKMKTLKRLNVGGSRKRTHPAAESSPKKVEEKKARHLFDQSTVALDPDESAAAAAATDNDQTIVARTTKPMFPENSILAGNIPSWSNIDNLNE